MSLGNALQVAQNSLLAVSRRTDVVSRNVSGANDTNYVRREAVVVPGSPRSATHVSRAALDAGLVRSGLDARSDSGAREVIRDMTAALSLDLNGPSGERSPAAALGRLQDALQTWSATPADALLPAVALDAARGVERAFHDADAAISRATGDVDRRVHDDVGLLNETLQAFGAANGEIVRASRQGLEPPLDAFDRRDAALRDIASIVPVSTLARADGDLMVTTRNGTTLFETVARTVSFDANGTNALLVDGVPMRGSADAREPRGRLEALLHVRDEVLPTARRQLDAAANGTTEAFAPSGLFAASVSPATAATIGVPPGYDMTTLRAGPASYADNIIAAAESLDTPRTFPTGTGLANTGGLLAYAGEAITALDQRQSDAAGAASRSVRILEVLDEKRVRQGGVDVDAEMTRLLALERSYEATARIIAVADRMLAELMAAVR